MCDDKNHEGPQPERLTDGAKLRKIIPAEAVGSPSRRTRWERLRPHVIKIAENGQLADVGAWSMSADQLTSLFSNEIPQLISSWKRPRIMFFACSGLESEDTVLEQFDSWRALFLANEIYPIFFLWQTDLFAQICRLYATANSESVRIERTNWELYDARWQPRIVWMAAQENALAATDHQVGAARMVCTQLRKLRSLGFKFEVHLVAHGLGAVFHALFGQLLAARGGISHGMLAGDSGRGIPIKTVTLWAPACTLHLFRETYLWLLIRERIESISTFALDEETELRDALAGVYPHSFLHLVSNFLEGRVGLPWEDLMGTGPVPMLGLQQSLKRDEQMNRLTRPLFEEKIDFVFSPNEHSLGNRRAARATSHRGFAKDEATLLATIARILGKRSAIE